MAKLTLNIEPDQIERVKRYALRHHTSVSKLFSEIINKITENEEKLEDNVLLEKYKNKINLSVFFIVFDCFHV